MSEWFEVKKVCLLAAAVVMALGVLPLSACSDEESVDAPATSDVAVNEDGVVDGGEDADSAASAIDGQTVLEASCTQCHTTALIYLQSDATDWNAIIDRMDEKHTEMFESNLTDGVGLTPERRAAIVEFMKSRTHTQGEQVVRDKCVGCHDLSNITKQAQDADWQTIVDRMTDEHDASLTGEEQQSAVNFLRGE
ncbi:MAG: hypothetical protein ACYC2X_07115 [Coriobacteriia bacterium]